MNGIDRQVVVAEEYLVQVVKKSQTCRSLDQLRCHLYHHARSPCLDDLPPTSNATKLHIKRAFYATHQMINVLGKTEDDILDPRLYGFEVVDDLLDSQDGKYAIPEEYTRLSGAIVPNVPLSAAPVEKTTCLAPHSDIVAVG